MEAEGVGYPTRLADVEQASDPSSLPRDKLEVPRSGKPSRDSFPKIQHTLNDCVHEFESAYSRLLGLPVKGSGTIVMKGMMKDPACAGVLVIGAAALGCKCPARWGLVAGLLSGI